MDKKEFISSAKIIGLANGYDPNILITQAIHESGNFKKVIGQTNVWGLKIPQKSKWTGKVHTVFTREQIRKIPGETLSQAIIRMTKIFGVDSIDVKSINAITWEVLLPQKFRDWQTIEESINGYINHIRINFPKAYSLRDKYMEYFYALVNGDLKYATDLNYASKCIALYNQVAKGEIK